MKKSILLLTAVTGLAYVLLTSYAAGPATRQYDCTGAEAACTGAFASNPTGCTTCHGSTAASTVTVTVALDSAGTTTTHYRGGMTYNVKITGTTTSSNTKYGFQLSAMKGTTTATTVSDAGVFSTTGIPASTHIKAPTMGTALTIAEHSSALTATGSTFTLSFPWTAPATGTGSISFWGAVNFVNGNGTDDAGDKWNLNHIAIAEWPLVSSAITSVENNNNVIAFPNPVSNTLNLQFTNATSGAYSVSVFDMSGKSISNQNIDVTGANYVTSLNTSNWTAGIYSVVIENNGTRTFTSVVKN